jgi:polyisoprenoid-binding protein YceI
MKRSSLPAVSLLAALLGARVVLAAPAYATDPAASRIDFTGIQAGAEFKGTFHKFAATIEFAPDGLSTSHFDVVIDLNSVDTIDKDRDTTIRGPDIFDVAHFPTAHYVTRVITKTAGGYSALGSLTLRGVTKDVPIDFQWIAAPAGAKLMGTATLKRLDFAVGRGDWKSTEWIADSVKIAFSLGLQPKS